MLNTIIQNKKHLKIKRKKHKIHKEQKHRKINLKYKLNFKYLKRLFMKCTNRDNVNNLISSISKMHKKNIIHKNKMARLQSKYQLLYNKNSKQ